MLRLRARKTKNVSPRELVEVAAAFRPAMAGLGGKMAGALFLALGVTALELLRPWPVTWVIDHLVSNAVVVDTGTGATTTSFAAPLTPILVFAAIAFLVPMLGGIGSERLQLMVARISRKATVRIRADVFEQIHRIEYAQHHRHFSGDLLVRLMGDVNMVRDLLFSSWLVLISNGSLLIGSVIVFAFVDWALLLVALIPVPLLALDMQRTSKKVRKSAGKSRVKEGHIAATAAESIRNVGLVKAFAAEGRTAHAFRSTARSAERATMATAKHTASLTRRTELLTGAGVSLVLLVGSARVLNGLLSPGELVLVVSYTRSLYKPLRKITTEGARLGKAMACSHRVLDLLNQPTEDPTAGRRVTSLSGDIVLDEVTHHYPDGRRSLDQLSVTLPGERLVAVSGENGTGKSTLLSLLLRLHRPTSGQISIAGTPIDEMQLDDYRDRFAYVPQQLALFSGTIRENIAFGRPGASGAEILAAAEAALLLPVVDQLPDGLDTMLTESGGALSGGQARRVMLARAAVRDPDIVLLDEPLVGLDPDAERLVVEAIRNIAEGRTTLVIHHGDLDALDPDLHVRLSATPNGTAATASFVTTPTAVAS